MTSSISATHIHASFVTMLNSEPSYQLSSFCLFLFGTMCCFRLCLVVNVDLLILFFIAVINLK